MATGESELRIATAASLDCEVRVPATVYDLQGFRDWLHSDCCDERSRCSFLAGEVFVDMSPEEIESHNKPKNDIAYGLTGWVRRQDLGEILADGALLVNEGAELSTEPDISFCSWDRLRRGQVCYVELVAGSRRFVEVHGSPDLIVEFISESSVRKDTQRLPDLYYRADVGELWLIDARGKNVDFQLLTRGDDQCQPAEIDEDGYHRSEVLNGWFLIERDRNPVGGYRYTLLSK